MGLPFTSITSAMPLPQSAQWPGWALGKTTGLVNLRLSRVPRVRATVYFFSESAGNDSNDGRDTVGLSLSAATYTASTQIISGTFTYTYTPGDLIYCNGGTCPTGLYKLLPASTTNSLVLAATADTTVDGTLAAPTANGTFSSSSGPWKTIAKATTQLGTYTAAQVVNTRFRFRRGDIWTEQTALGSINVSNFTLDDYGNGDKPFWNRHGSNTITAGWTNIATTTTYTITVPAGTISIRQVAHRLTSPLRYAFNQGSDALDIVFVKANANSFCVTSGNLMYLNLGGPNPNTAYASGGIPFETNTSNTTNGITITDGNDNVRVMNLRMDGWGQNTGSQAYGIQAYSSAYGEIVIDGVEEYYTGYHSHGTSSNAGQSVVTFANCVSGWTTYFGGDEINYISYSGATSGSAGENIFYNCHAPYASLPNDSAAEYNSTFPQVSVGQTAFYGHTAGATWSIYLRINCTIGNGDSVGWSPAPSDGIGNLPSASAGAGNISTCVGIVFGERMMGFPQIAPALVFQPQNMAVINSQYTACLAGHFQSNCVDGGSGNQDNGWLINSIVEVDCQYNYPSSTFPDVAYASASVCTQWHSYINLFNSYNTQGIFDNGPIASYCFNNIYRLNGNPYENNVHGATNSATYLGGNVYAGVQTFTGTGGFSADPAATVTSIQGTLGPPDSSSQYLNAGIALPGDTPVAYDMNLNARPGSNPTPGPYEYVTPGAGLSGSGSVLGNYSSFASSGNFQGNYGNFQL